MTSQIVKEPDELWTGDLVRRLKDIGMEFSDFRAIDANNSLFQEGDLSFRLDSTTYLTTDQSIIWWKY